MCCIWTVRVNEEQAKGRRERERERKRKGKEQAKLEVKLWQKRKKLQTPSRESNPGPQQTQLMLYYWATETSNITSRFVWILSVPPPLHNIGIIQCPQTNPLCFAFPSSSFPFPSPFDLSLALKPNYSHLPHKQFVWFHFTTKKWRRPAVCSLG